MSTPDLDQPLDDDELDALHELLVSRAEDDSLVLDGVHGLVTAVAIGPRRWRRRNGCRSCSTQASRSRAPSRPSSS
jgi:hypothetical protein